jgi:hypothetical protein
MTSSLFLPYEFTATLLTGSSYDTDPFGIDPEQTTLVTGVDTDPFAIDPEQTTLVAGVDTDPFGIDPEQTTLITTGLDNGP